MRNFALDNYRSVLKTIFLEPGIKRYEISALLHMAPASVTKYCDMLLKKQIVTEDSKARGRNVSLSVNPRWRKMLGIDIGAFQTRIGMLNADGSFSLIDEFSTPDDPHALIPLMEKYAVAADGVGAAVTGVIEKDDRTLSIFPNKRSWDGFSFGALNMPNLFVTTSGRAAANYEKNLGVLKDYPNALHINFGFGIQSGLYINGALVKGDTNAAGEFGHVYASALSGKCTCGNTGCLENLATVPVIIWRLQGKIKHGGASGPLAELCKNDASAITPEMVMRANAQGDPLVAAELHITTDAIASALSGIVNVINPSAISLGGRLAEFHPSLADAVSESLKRKVLQANSKSLVILKSASPLYGACAGAALLPMLNAIRILGEK